MLNVRETSRARNLWTPSLSETLKRPEGGSQHLDGRGRLGLITAQAQLIAITANPEQKPAIWG
jgi:hypothetical protein